MDSDETPAMTADEQLGSPVWTFEQGLLLGLLLGLAMLTIWTRRAGRRTHGDPTS